MIFNVKVVEPAEYEAHLEELAATGKNASEEPLIGGSFVRDQVGLESTHEEESE